MTLVLYILIGIVFLYNIVMGYARAEDGNGATIVHCTLALVLALVFIFRRLLVV